MKKITKELFLAATIETICKVYVGKRECCRCGCGGSYTDTSYSLNEDKDVDDDYVQLKLDKAKKLVEGGAEVLYGDTFVDVKVGTTRTYTFYFEDTEKKLDLVEKTKVTVVIPSAQLLIIRKALNLYQAQFKIMNSDPSQDEASEQFDMFTLAAMMDYKISIELTESEKESFSGNHGVDFPQYIYD